MAIDWNGTGEMLSGWGTLAGAAAVAYAAWVGRSTFSGWKQQKQEERRMDAAERIVTLAYRLKYNLESVRSPVLRALELAEAEERIRTANPEIWASWGTEDRERAVKGGAYLHRLAQHDTDWQAIWQLKPLALALFGPEVQKGLHAFWAQYIAVSAAAEACADDDGSDREFSKKLRSDLSTASKDSEITKAVESAVQGLESHLLPVIRRS